MLWDLNEGKHLYSLEAGDVVNALVFSPNRYWLCAATATCVKIFDLESKYVTPLECYCTALMNMSGPSSMSSSPLTPTSARKAANPSVSPSPGPLTARLSSLASPTTLSVSGPLHHKSVYSCHTSDSIIHLEMTKTSKHVIMPKLGWVCELHVGRFSEISFSFRVVPPVQATKVHLHAEVCHVELQFADMCDSGTPTVSAMLEGMSY